MRKIVLGVFLGLLAGLLLGKANAVDTPVQPEEVAAAYFVAIQASDLDAAGRLFARESNLERNPAWRARVARLGARDHPNSSGR